MLALAVFRSIMAVWIQKLRLKDSDRKKLFSIRGERLQTKRFDFSCRTTGNYAQVDADEYGKTRIRSCSI